MKSDVNEKGLGNAINRVLCLNIKKIYKCSIDLGHLEHALEYGYCDLSSVFNVMLFVRRTFICV